MQCRCLSSSISAVAFCILFFAVPESAVYLLLHTSFTQRVEETGTDLVAEKKNIHLSISEEFNRQIVECAKQSSLLPVLEGPEGA